MAVLTRTPSSPRFPLRPRTADAPSWLALGAACWLLMGAFLLVLTPLPAHTERLGWSPLFWLLLAPCAMLAGMHAGRAARTRRVRG